MSLFPNYTSRKMIDAALTMYNEKMKKWYELPEADRDARQLDVAWDAVCWVVGWLANQHGGRNRI